MDAAKDCPTCGLVNPSTAQRCDCGWDFAERRVARSYLTDADRGRRADDAAVAGTQLRVLRAAVSVVRLFTG